MKYLLLILFFLNIQLSHASSDIWYFFRNHFIQSDGRVIDNKQNKISHSEGQGYGMLLSIEYNDPRTFDQIWQWTKKHLKREQDYLFAWKWGTDNQQYKVLDQNNATDGELLILWGLLKGYEKWRVSEYKLAANQIQKSVIEKLLRKIGNRYFLLPGEIGFEHESYVRLNPSYLVFPALERLRTQYAGPWLRILEDAQWLIKESLMLEVPLPSDWIEFNQDYHSIFARENFSSESIRVWLYTAIASSEPKTYNGFHLWQSFYDKYGYYPNRFDRRDFEFDGFAMPGYWAVSARVLYEKGESGKAHQIWEKAKAKLLKEEKNYYSTALFLLSRMGVRG